jgi:hypothetical protein
MGRWVGSALIITRLSRASAEYSVVLVSATSDARSHVKVCKARSAFSLSGGRFARWGGTRLAYGRILSSRARARASVRFLVPSLR